MLLLTRPQHSAYQMGDCRKFFPPQLLAYDGLNCSNVLLTILGGQPLTIEKRKHLIVIFNYLHNITILLYHKHP